MLLLLSHSLIRLLALTHSLTAQPCGAVVAVVAVVGAAKDHHQAPWQRRDLDGARREAAAAAGLRRLLLPPRRLPRLAEVVVLLLRPPSYRAPAHPAC